MKLANEKVDALIIGKSEKDMGKKRWEHGQSLCWDNIAKVLNILEGFSVNQRSVREHFTCLLNKYKQ